MDGLRDCDRCVTSTEKLGNQLTYREAVETSHGITRSNKINRVALCEGEVVA